MFPSLSGWAGRTLGRRRPVPNLSGWAGRTLGGVLFPDLVWPLENDRPNGNLHRRPGDSDMQGAGWAPGSCPRWRRGCVSVPQRPRSGWAARLREESTAGAVGGRLWGALSRRSACGGPASTGPGEGSPRPAPRAEIVCVSFWKLSRPGAGSGRWDRPGADVGSLALVLRGSPRSEAFSPPSAPALSIFCASCARRRGPGPGSGFSGWVALCRSPCAA